MLLDIQRMSSEDGPGLRTTAFLKGCPLACAWCHNPESISRKGEVLWHSSRCIGCVSCIQVCPQKGIELTSERLSIAHERCLGCFSCAQACPTRAIEAKGTPIEATALARELLKDRAYFDRDGGITLSGGEALLQAESIELLRILKEAQVEVAVDTCGLISVERLAAALELADIVLYDLKLADDEQHKRWTGVGNGQILTNLALVADWAARKGRLWIRTPIIPGATDSDDNIRGLAEIIGRLPTGPSVVERWELCAFNNLGASKYESIERAWEFESVALMTQTRMQELVSLAHQHVDITDIHATGAMT